MKKSGKNTESGAKNAAPVVAKEKNTGDKAKSLSAPVKADLAAPAAKGAKGAAAKGTSAAKGAADKGASAAKGSAAKGTSGKGRSGR